MYPWYLSRGLPFHRTWDRWCLSRSGAALMDFPRLAATPLLPGAVQAVPPQEQDSSRRFRSKSLELARPNSVDGRLANPLICN